MILRKPFTATGGNLLAVDSNTYVENTQPTAANQGLAGPAQRAATDSDVHTDGTPSPGGLYSAAYPLRDGTDRLLVSWTSCRIVDSGRIVPCATRVLWTRRQRRRLRSTDSGSTIAAPARSSRW